VEVDVMLSEREEILRALRTIGCQATATEIYSCCPSFVDQHALVDELRAMESEGLVVRNSAMRPSRYALPATPAGDTDTPARPVDPSPERGTGEVAAVTNREVRETKPSKRETRGPRNKTPAPFTRTPAQEIAMPKPQISSSVEIVLEAIKASRDPISHAELVAATHLPRQKVSSALNGLKKRDEIHVAGFLDGNRRAALHLPGPAPTKGKAVVARAAAIAPAQAPTKALSSGGGRPDAPLGV
jgi:hypothetical protein